MVLAEVETKFVNVPNGQNKILSISEAPIGSHLKAVTAQINWQATPNVVATTPASLYISGTALGDRTFTHALVQGEIILSDISPATNNIDHSGGVHWSGDFPIPKDAGLVKVNCVVNNETGAAFQLQLSIVWETDEVTPLLKQMVDLLRRFINR